MTNSDDQLDLETSEEISPEEFKNLKAEVAELSEAEAQGEWLESCRYGEVDVLRALLSRFPTLTGYIDANSGNSGLHNAAANGHLSVVKFLVYHKHGFTKNNAGNTPLHWASANGQAEVVTYFTKNTELNNIDVLAKNDFGRSALTEG
jgi:hypothetical protein